MAPLELYLGALAKDDDGHEFFVNDKDKLPIIVKPGKRVKKAYKQGNTQLEVEAACSKNDLGSTIIAKTKTVTSRMPHPDSPAFFEIERSRSMKSQVSIVLGQSITIPFENEYMGNLKLAVRAKHTVKNK